MSPTAPVPGYNISDLDAVVSPLTQLVGAEHEADIPLGPVGSGRKNVKYTTEQLLVYLRGQGLFTAESAALRWADASTATLHYETTKNLAGPEVEGLGLAITTSTGTTHALLQNVTSVYDSQTGLLDITLDPGIDPAGVLSVHLFRPGPVQEAVLASDLFPFGGGGSSGFRGTPLVIPLPSSLASDGTLTLQFLLDPAYWGLDPAQLGTVVVAQGGGPVQSGGRTHADVFAAPFS